MAVCEILSVGTELLLGDILNTDTRFLARELADMGISVLHHSTVGDNDARLTEALRLALSRSEIVLVTGGLGPTADDITREVCCRELGCELVLDRQIADEIEAYFSQRDTEMPQTNIKQAYVPVGGTVFYNNNGTAPGLAIKKDGKCVIMLPGPPGELEPMFRESAAPYLADYSDGSIVSQTVHVMGLGESAMAQMAGNLLDLMNPTVAPYAKQGEALLRVTAKAADKNKALELCAPVVDEIKKRLGDYVYGVDCGNIETAVSLILRERGKSLSSAESCTGGLIAKRMTDIPGSSEVFVGGAVTYTNDLKAQLLCVSQKTLDRFGAVSAETCEEMARGAVHLTGSDYAVATTGIAGPGSEGDLPAGLAYIAVSDGVETVVDRVNTGRTSRDYNRAVIASRALNLVRTFITAK